MHDSIKLLSIFILILATAILVAAEFAFVKVRKSKVDEMIDDGNIRALKLRTVLLDLDSYLSACRVGIIMIALALGWMGGQTVEGYIAPLFRYLGVNDAFSYSLSFFSSFLIITLIHVVFGEMTPKIISIQQAEKTSLFLASPLIYFNKIMYPLIWILNATSIAFVRLLGFKPVSDVEDLHTEEEIKLIVSSSSGINADEKAMVEKIFTFDDTIAREIMVHRKDMVCLYMSDNPDVVLKTIQDSKHSRIPVCGEDRDDIRGYINAKDVFGAWGQEIELTSLIRTVPWVYETTPIKIALKRLQKQRHQLAIVFDEYGGVSGMITLEDIVEELVGDIKDEFDNAAPDIVKRGKEYLVRGHTHIEEVCKALGVDIPPIKGVDTIGGILLANLNMATPKENMVVRIDGYNFVIQSVAEERILSILIQKDR